MLALQLKLQLAGHHVSVAHIADVLATCTGCAVHERKVKHLVNLVVQLGLRDAGYEYFNLDGAF